MSFDRTQDQSPDEQRKARELSLEPSRPPAQVPGYQLRKFLGSGAYGEVWSATDLNMGRSVAIKFYTRRSSADVQLLAREVEKLVVLAADRYVVQLLDVGWDADPPYYVMDYFEHGSLEDRLGQSKGLPTDEAIDLFQEVATGMMHLHGKGVLHCDLKPGNVLLDQDGKPRVADFGQSRMSTEDSSALGTLFYMAPEQADLSAAPDARWDVYGLGALLFSMLTGKPPYYSPQLANKIEVCDNIHERLIEYQKGIRNAAKPTEHRSVAGVDRALADIIDRCIVADPKKRFRNIQSLLSALRQREMAKASRPLMVLGLLGPLLLISVMSLFGWWAFRQAVQRTKVEITKKSVESNEFAAQLAARSAAEQIDEYFRVVGQLSRDQGFQDAFAKVVNDPELRELRTALSDPFKNAKQGVESDEEIGQLRHEFKNDSLRDELQKLLEDRLFDRTGDFPVAASWFVCDRFGNQIASAFPRENKTLGGNYSYRTYFTGRDRDLKKRVDGRTTYEVSDELESREIIERPHLSAVFISEQSNTWKVAFSAPIRLSQDGLAQGGPVEGIVAVSVNLGNFVEFNNNRNTHYAMMVDTRTGENPGVILEHPLFEKLLGTEGRIPTELSDCRVDLSSLDSSSMFRDPIGETLRGKEFEYDQVSIVAQEEVTMEDYRLRGNRNKTTLESGLTSKEGQTNVDRLDTGLVVLAVVDHESIVAPANDLSRQLGRLALLAALFLAGVTIVMWLFVKRMLQESKQRLERAFSPSTESSSLENMETIAAGAPSRGSKPRTKTET